MFGDFEIMSEEMEVLSSPICRPMTSFDPILDIGIQIEEPNFTLESFAFDDLDTCSQPTDLAPDTGVEACTVTLNEYKMPQINRKPKEKTKSESPTVFKPFSSFLSLEVTVQSLRSVIGTPMQRSKSLPVSFLQF